MRAGWCAGLECTRAVSSGGRQRGGADTMAPIRRSIAGLATAFLRLGIDQLPLSEKHLPRLELLLTWAWVKRTRRFLRWESGNWMPCCLASIPQPASPPIWPGIPDIELLGPRIRLETETRKPEDRIQTCTILTIFRI